MSDKMRYLTVAECAAFGGFGDQNEGTPTLVKDGKVHRANIYTTHVSGWREPRPIEHGSRTYGNLVAAIDRGEVIVGAP